MKKPYHTLLKAVILILMVFLIYVAAILGVNTIFDYHAETRAMDVPFSEPSTENSRQSYSVFTWNIGYGGLGKEADFFYEGGEMVRPGREESEAYFNGVLATIQSFRQADFVLLQEIDTDAARSYHRQQFDEICKRLPGYLPLFAMNYRVPFVPFPILRPMGKVRSGLATFSAMAIEDAYQVAFPGNYPWPKMIFMPDRCFISMSTTLPGGKKLHVINTHNSAFDDGSLRKEQLRMLFQHLDSLYSSGGYVVAGGDWNVNPPGFEAAYFSNGDPAFRVDVFPEIFDNYPDWQVAYDNDFPTNRDVSEAYSPGMSKTTIIDFYICSPNVTIQQVSTVNDGFLFSDHQPVYLRFTLD